jgi:cytochrome b
VAQPQRGAGVVAVARATGVRVWDALVRLAHGVLAATVIFDWVRDDGDRLHRTVGYVAVGAVLVRLLWAALARRGYASLSHLKPSLSATRAYLRAGAPRQLGHDPLGLWMVWLLWALVLLLGLTGWVSRLDAFWGEDWPITLHAWLADALIACVLVHLLGVAGMSWHWRENLPASMLSGRKRGEDGVR